MAQKVLDALVAKFGAAITHTETQHGDDIAFVGRDDLVAIMTWLRDDPAMQMDSPSACTAIDWLGHKTPRFEVCYQLRSSVHLHRVRIKVPLEEHDLHLPSMTPLWKGFNWPERETYDMYGVQFRGHPDLRRILMYEQFVGHPLRKDYPKEKRQPLVRRDRTDL